MKPVVLYSTIADGNMLIQDEFQNASEVENNRNNFLNKNSINGSNCAVVKISYDKNDYCVYHEIDDQKQTVTADALVTHNLNQPILLPLADCLGAAIFDTKQNILMVSHLGRHSLEQNGGLKSIKFLVDNYNCDPSDLHIWLSPAAGKQNYPLFLFNNQGIAYTATCQFLTAGVQIENVTNCNIDTTQDRNYFSHSEFTKNNRQSDGRFCIVAIMQG